MEHHEHTIPFLAKAEQFLSDHLPFFHHNPQPTHITVSHADGNDSAQPSPMHTPSIDAPVSPNPPQELSAVTVQSQGESHTEASVDHHDLRLDISPHAPDIQYVFHAHVCVDCGGDGHAHAHGWR